MIGPAPVFHAEHLDDQEPARDQVLELTVIGRVREFYKVSRWGAFNAWPPESAIYAVLHSPGRATNTQSDGGLAMKADLMDGEMSSRRRAYEVMTAMRAMPAGYRRAIEATYNVPVREKPRTVRVAAAMVGVGTATYGKMMAAGLAWLQGRLCIAHITVRETNEAAWAVETTADPAP